MKIELHNKKIFFIDKHNKTEIHPIWLRERVRDEKFLDKNNDQRLFDPSFLENISVEKAKIDNDMLELMFNDGVASKFEINPQKIQEWNEIEDVSKIFPGQVLKLFL